MRIAIFALDMERRYFLLRLAEETLLYCGILPEFALFPMITELTEESVHRKKAFDLAIVDGLRDTHSLQTLCRCSTVILIGKREDGAAAYELGAKYFLESPADKMSMDKALTRCLSIKKRK